MSDVRCCFELFEIENALVLLDHTLNSVAGEVLETQMEQTELSRAAKRRLKKKLRKKLKREQKSQLIPENAVVREQEITVAAPPTPPQDKTCKIPAKPAVQIQKKPSFEDKCAKVREEIHNFSDVSDCDCTRRLAINAFLK